MNVDVWEKMNEETAKRPRFVVDVVDFICLYGSLLLIYIYLEQNNETKEQDV
ncbi:MAG: hypothetical protein MUP70_14065 [Candidatus Aminicenantes bacterium]|nr:hypothetical protein [Candidatus Aminicenantes bacterium]